VRCFVLRLPCLLGANFSARGGESDNVGGKRANGDHVDDGHAHDFMERESRCVLFNNQDLPAKRWNIESGGSEFGFVHDDKWSDGCRDALFLLFDRHSLRGWDVRHGKRHEREQRDLRSF